MSRITKWKLEKTKVKVVFRLQFHATQIPQNGWERLFISLIPTETGKMIAKTSKANVRNGTCKWSDPIYETTRLLLDAKRKLYDDKLYKLVVGMGSSHSSILGEATMNLSDYVDALKPSTVALPLQGTGFGTILHVTVQLLTSKTGFREFEQQRETGSSVNREAEIATASLSSSELQISNNQSYKVNTRIRLRAETKELPSLVEQVGINDESGESQVECDGSSNFSESFYVDKHDSSSIHGFDSLKGTVPGDLSGESHSQSLQAEKGDPFGHDVVAQGSSEWVQGWSSVFSMDNDLAIACEDSSKLSGSLELAVSTIFELKLELNTLQNQADEISVETQKFAQLLIDEIASGQELAKEVSLLKLQCLKFKHDLEEYRNVEFKIKLTAKDSVQTDLEHVFQGKPFKWFKGLLFVEDRIRELQEKTFIGLHDTDFSFVNTELVMLLSVMKDLKATVESVPNVLPREGQHLNELMSMRSLNREPLMLGNECNVNLYEPEDTLQYVSMTTLVPQHPGSKRATDVLEEKIFDLLRQLEEAKIERDNVVRKMDQMECYYETLVQELEENQKRNLGELQSLRSEHSTCLYAMSTSRAEVESIRHDMNEQILRFSEERCVLDSLNKDLERRAIAAESALKRARLNYTIAVNQLQKDLDLLSFQVLSMFETNQNLIKEAFSETSKLALPGYPDVVGNPQKTDASLMLPCRLASAGIKKQLLGGDVLSDDLKKSLCFQEDLYQKVEEELCEMRSGNLFLDVFSETLKQILLEANTDIWKMKEKLDELEQQLELSNKSRDLLLIRLQAATEDVLSLKEQNASCLTKCSGMLMENNALEARLESVSNENILLMQKTTECEVLIRDYRVYESQYQAAFAEKLELETSLKLEIQENCNLQEENSSLNEKLKILEAGYSELALSKETLQKVVRFFHEKLGSLLVAYGKQSGELSSFNDNLCQDLEFKDLNSMIMQLEEAQHDTCERVLQLMDQKKDLENERDTAILSLSIAKSEIHGMTLRFEHEIYAMAAKLDMSSSLVEKLQLQLESVVNKFNNSLEVENQHAQQSEEVLACLSTMELELQKIYSKDSDLAQEILSLGAMSEELGRSKLAISELVQEKQDFMMSLENKAKESIKLVTELDSLKECLKCVYEELHVERCSQAKLEDTVAGLTYQLNDKHEKLLHFDSQNAELAQVRELVSELESENSRILHLLLQQEESLKEFQKEQYCFNDLSSELLEMQVHAVAADICITFLRSQYQTFFEELVHQLQLSDGHHEELEKKNLMTEERLKHCLENEAHYIEEREKLLTTIESLGIEVKASIAQNVVEVEQGKSRLSELELSLSEGKTRHAIEVGLLNNMLAKSEQEVDSLILSKEELEIIRLILETKLKEHHVRISSPEQHNDELMMLRNRCNELSYKLSEQILKKEEFKNLSIHLKELKDNADAECALACEKKEPGGPSVAMQESLRMAFIKEQYETRLHELKQHLSVSKKHGEEMLFKLQDAIDETENRKKSEASQIRRNEELALKIVELEAELQLVISDKREIVKSYDRIQAELECALLSLECCKEEKGKLDVSLQECEKVKSNIVAELSSVKLQLKNSSCTNSPKEENGEAGRQMQLSGGLRIEMDRGNPLTADLSCATGSIEVYENLSTESSSSNKLAQNGFVYDSESQDVSSPTTGEDECLAAFMSSQSIQVISDSGSVYGITEQAHEVDLLFNNSNQLAVARDNVGAHHLKSCMEHLDEELERMKNENSLLSQTSYDASFQDLQRELLQLHQVNQELGSIYPLFNNFTGSGSALDRVLALEIELAEALREKNKSSMKFQSSFLKQHGDKEAIFKSFRDINELIKDMLEIKGKYVTVESELKEMHNRYSELSLQFAEVEGERQKLLMTLKNVRSSRKALESNRSMPVDHPL